RAQLMKPDVEYLGRPAALRGGQGSTVLGVRNEVVQEQCAGGVAGGAVHRPDDVVGAQLAAEAPEDRNVPIIEPLGVLCPSDVYRLAGVVDDADVLHHADAVVVEGTDAFDRLAGDAAFEHAGQFGFGLFDAGFG